MQPLSLTTAKLDLLRETTSGGSATGFFYAYGDLLYLITNWHVVTGANPVTQRALDEKTGFLPDRLTVHVKIVEKREGSIITARSSSVDLPLLRDDKPTWIEHPSRHNVDVVALQFAPPEHWGNRTINSIDLEHRLQPEAGCDCFIIGHPEGLSGPALTPIWKRGAIATESHPAQNSFLVDSASRKGMSGAPVVARHDGLFGSNAGITDDTIIGTVENFVGIYSGRVGDDALGFQLGTVWKSDVLAAIFETKTAGHHPLI